MRENDSRLMAAGTLEMPQPALYVHDTARSAGNVQHCRTNSRRMLEIRDSSETGNNRQPTSDIAHRRNVRKTAHLGDALELDTEIGSESPPMRVGLPVIMLEAELDLHRLIQSPDHVESLGKLLSGKELIQRPNGLVIELNRH